MDDVKPRNRSNLHRAVKKSYTKMLINCIKRGDDVNSRDRYGMTPVCLAVAQESRVDHVRLLVEAGCDVDIADNKGMTPLLFALTYSNSSTDIVNYVKILLGASALTLHEKSLDGKPLVSIISRACNASYGKGIIYYRGKDGRSFTYHTLPWYTYMEIAIMLIKAGYGVFHFNDPHRLYPTLMDVVCCYQIGLVEILLSAGANPDISDKNQLAPMHFATHWNLRGLGKLLILANCDIHAATSDRITPLRLGNENMDNAFVDMVLSVDFDATRETGIEGYKNAYAKARVEELKRVPGTLLSLARCAVRRCGYVKVGNFERNVAALELPQHLKDDLIFKNIL